MPYSSQENRWVRQPGEIAFKVSRDAVPGIFRKGIIVEAGTKLVFLRNGRIEGILPEGKWDMGGLSQKIGDLAFFERVEGVFVDDSLVRVQVTLDGLVTREMLPLAARLEVEAKIDAADLFFVNFMKSRDAATMDDLTRYLSMELAEKVRAEVSSSSSFNLYSDAETRGRMDDSLRFGMRQTLDSIGVRAELKSVGWVHPPEVLDLFKQEGVVSLEERRAGLEVRRVGITQQQFELVAKQKLMQISLAAREAQYTKGLIKEDEMKDLYDRIRGEQIELDSQIEKTRRVQDFERAEDLKDVEMALAMKAALAKQKVASQWDEHKLELDRRKAEFELSREAEAARVQFERERAGIEAERLKVRSAASDVAILSMAEGEKGIEAIAKIAEMERGKALTKEQLEGLAFTKMAEASKESPTEAAKAMAEKFKADVVAKGAELGAYKEAIETAARLRAEQDRAQAEVVKAAHPPAPGSTIRVVTAPATGLPRTCPNCRTVAPVSAKFCPECGTPF